MASFNVGRFIVCPDKKLYGILIKIKEVKPAFLAKLASAAAEGNVDVLYFSYLKPLNLGEAGWSLAFLDFTESNITPKKFVKQIKQLEFLENVIELKPRIKGFLVDEASFPLVVGENRAVIIRDVGLKGLMFNIRRHVGSGAEAFLYFLGFEAGVEFAKEHKRLAGLLKIKDKLKIIRGIAPGLFMSMGYGIIRLLKLKEDPPYILQRIYRCIECEQGANTKKPFSHFIRGVISGFSTEIFGVKMFTRENKCIAKGDPYCEFETFSEEGGRARKILAKKRKG